MIQIKDSSFTLTPDKAAIALGKATDAEIILFRNAFVELLKGIVVGYVRVTNPEKVRQDVQVLSGLLQAEIIDRELQVKAGWIR